MLVKATVEIVFEVSDEDPQILDSQVATYGLLRGALYLEKVDGSYCQAYPQSLETVKVEELPNL